MYSSPPVSIKSPGKHFVPRCTPVNEMVSGTEELKTEAGAVNARGVGEVKAVVIVTRVLVIGRLAALGVGK